MSSATKTRVAVQGAAKLPTISQRTSEAARLAGEFLGLDDLKRLGAALAEAASEGIQRNPNFAAHVRALYEQMAPKPAVSRSAKAPRSKALEPDVELIPVNYAAAKDANLDPTAPPDPYFLLDFYGAHQLALALKRYTPARLREAVKMVKQRNPRTKPKGTSGQALIDYIVEYVAGT
jgi:hypothetical protein